MTACGRGMPRAQAGTVSLVNQGVRFAPPWKAARRGVLGAGPLRRPLLGTAGPLPVACAGPCAPGPGGFAGPGPVHAVSSAR